MVQIIVQVSPSVARALLHQQQPDADAEELLQVLNELNIKLEALHPGLPGFLKAEVADAVIAQHVVERLRTCRGVEAAYIKPPDALP